MTPPLKEREPFLRAIIEAPDDDALRLVYSDWLEEQGDIERATFIRNAIQLANTEVKDAELEKRLYTELLAQYSQYLQQWLDSDGITAGLSIPEYRRGMIEIMYYYGPEAFFADAEQLFATAPIRSLTIHCSQKDSLSDEGLLRLAAMPELARLHTLMLWDQQGIAADAWAALFHSPGLRNLTTLGVANCPLDEADVKVIASSPMLANLRRLDLSYNDPGVGACRALIASPHLQRLEHLALHHCFFGNDPEEEQLFSELETRFVRVSYDEAIKE